MIKNNYKVNVLNTNSEKEILRWRILITIKKLILRGWRWIEIFALNYSYIDDAIVFSRIKMIWIFEIKFQTLTKYNFFQIPCNAKKPKT